MSERILIKSIPDVPFSLYRTIGISRYFYIAHNEKLKGSSIVYSGVMIYIPEGMRYFSAQALAVDIYFSFVKSLKK